MSLRLAISALLPPKQRFGGVASFADNLLLGVSEVAASGALGADPQVTVFHFDGQPITQRAGLRYEAIPPRRGRFYREAELGWRRGREFDGFLFLNYFTPPRVGAERVVTTIHDLQYRHLPQAWPWRKRKWLDLCLRHTLRKCTTVATISEAVRQDVLAQFGQQHATRVQAIWNPVRWQEPVAEAPAAIGERPFLLAVGVDRPQKNFATLIQAFAKLKDDHPDLALVIAGQLRSTRHDAHERTGAMSQELPSTVELVERLGLSDRVIVTGFVDNDVLAALYQRAAAYVLPSLFEGFGMPAVEALGWGTPAITSDLPPLREVTLGAARYVADPLSADAMATEIDATLRAGESARPSAKFSQRIRDLFAPQAIARQYLSCLTGDASLTASIETVAKTPPG